MATQSHNVRLVGRCEAPNLFIRIKNSANHSIFLTLSPMRTMKVEQVQKLVFFMKCKDIIGLIGPAHVHRRRLKESIPGGPDVATDHVKKIVHRECWESFFGKEYRKGV